MDLHLKLWSRSSCPILLVQFNVVRGCQSGNPDSASLQCPRSHLSAVTPSSHHGHHYHSYTWDKWPPHLAHRQSAHQERKFCKPEYQFTPSAFQTIFLVLTTSLWEFDNLRTFTLNRTLPWWLVCICECMQMVSPCDIEACVSAAGDDKHFSCSTPEMVMVISNLCYVIHRSGEIGDFVCIRK